MRYIITEKKLNMGIYKFIDSSLKSDNVKPEYLEEYGKPLKTIVFFIGDSSYMPEDMDDLDFEEHECYFRYVKKERYNDIDPFGGMVEQAPALWFDHNEWRIKMDNIFGDVWHETFKQWFKDNYPQFPVKSFFFL